MQLLHSSVFPFLGFPGLLESGARNNWMWKSSLKEFYPSLFCTSSFCPFLGQSAEEERRGRDWEQDFRLCLQLHSSVSHLGPEAHKSNTPSEWQTRRQADRDTHCVRIDGQRRTQIDRWCRCHGVSGRHRFKCLWSAEIRGSTSCWSGSCTAAWWVILISVPLSAMSCLSFQTYLHIVL